MVWRVKRPFLAIGLFIIFSLLLLRYRPLLSETVYQEIYKGSTLGFDIVIPILPATSSPWRLSGLLAAANLTGLTINPLVQPKWSETELKSFHSGDKYSTWDIPGSTGCWLGHLHALRHFLATIHQTALILEDDADWSINLQTQTPLIQTALHSLVSPSSPGPDPTDPWTSSAWDILFLGHCGDLLPPPPNATHPTRLIQPFSDPDTLPDNSDYVGWYFSTLSQLPPSSRAVHVSTRPVCSFAYAITRKGAQKVLELDHTAKAIDTRIGRACRDSGWDGTGAGKEEGRLRCLSVSPEVVHHHVPGPETEGLGAASEIQKKQKAAQWGWTANVKYSARCNLGGGKARECWRAPPGYENFYEV